MADTSKITLGQLKTALTQAKNYTDNEIAGVTGASKVEPEELDMPKVFFYGTALPTSKTNVDLTMDYISNTTKFSSFVKLKCQGTSSMNYAKKNFTVAMYSDEARVTKLKKDFKGWGAQSKFCLKANYVDTTHTRNISGARIAYDMVNSRPDSSFKQQLLTAPRYGLIDGFPIKLYFNGEFYGIYTWNIPKDDWQFNMDSGNPNHMVLCAERNNDGSNTIDSVLMCEFRKEWDGSDGTSWSIEVGTYSDALKDSFNRCVRFVMNATDTEFHDNIGEYFDLYSLIDYYCFTYLTAHMDGLAKNMLMATYDGVIWGCSLYDMDSIYGANWNGVNFLSTTLRCPEDYQETNSLLWQRIESCFATELLARYNELRQGALSLSNIIKHVEEIYDVIPDRVFDDEKVKWGDLPGVSTNTMTRFRNYMRDRAVYVDAQITEIGTKIACTGITLSANSLSFTTTDAQTITATKQPSNTTDVLTWSVSPVGIVTVDGGVVTPIANGNCTITATCGSQTATCTVNVALPSIACTGITLNNSTLEIDASVLTTATLVATVTPDNCTDAITWSVSPEGIVTVENGLVTVVADGQATVTATCGGYTATCIINVSGLSGGGDDGYADIKLSKNMTIGIPGWPATNGYTMFEISNLPPLLDTTNESGADVLRKTGYSVVSSESEFKSATSSTLYSSTISNQTHLFIKLPSSIASTVDGFKSYIDSNEFTIESKYEEGCTKLIIDGTQSISVDTADRTDSVRVEITSIGTGYTSTFATGFLNSTSVVPWSSSGKAIDNLMYFRSNDGYLAFRISNDLLNATTVEGVRNYLKVNPIVLYVK